MRKQVLILGHNYATQFVDVYNQYTKVFNPAQYEVTTAYLTGAYDQQVRNRTLAENVIFLDFNKKSIRHLKLRAIYKLYQLCQQKNFNIVICHRFKPTYLLLWVARFLTFEKIFFVMHELGTMRKSGRQWLIRNLNKQNMIYAGVSNAVRDDMRKDLNRIAKNNIVTLHNMIDFELFEPQLYSRTEARELLNLPHDSFIFGNLARLAPNKDHHTLIKAFAQLNQHHPQIKLVIMGEGELEQTLKSIVNKLKLTNVIFTGFIPCAFRYMKAFDCFILTSTQEAFGRVLLEAMIAKCPIIASRVNGIPEVMGSRDILINPRDIDGFSKAMQAVYAMSDRDRLQEGEKNYQHALKHFSMQCFKEQFWNIYAS